MRNIEDCRPDGLVGNVLTVQKNACGAARDAAGRYGGIARLGGVERFTALQDDAGLNLGEVKKVPAVDWQRVDLLLGDHITDSRLIRVYLDGSRGHLNRYCRFSQLELETAAGRGAGLHHSGNRQVFETGMTNRNVVIAGSQRAKTVKAGRIGRQGLHISRINTLDDNGRIRENRARRVRDRPLD